ncbi:hypothetical protein C8A05DRAFT_16833 [Staphylotrichum tortipilum]|uniref:DUF1365-domain-containing protein n=1 Tax=Staphylotrichum tortipilum TaxID=2831512 RepID=A0AAN6RSX0_9PEZI|nr:hypothetical protein C8A05DRAFT_16833 [Staphylotrichum longicolle]
MSALAAVLTGLYSILTIFFGPSDVVLLVVFLVGRHTNILTLLLLDAATLRNASKLIAGICVFAFLAIHSVREVRARSNTPQWNGPGKVLLFPSQTSHARKFPQTHAFTYSYLTVGIPVGFHGNYGGVVSVEAAGKPGNFSWLSLFSPSGWFTVDAGDYLERGNSGLGLRGKLDAYLRSQGVQPERYPHAYLLTAPRFFGYHFNPVSFWYLYDAGQRLAAMIVEVNNTFDERRMYFLQEDTSSQQLDCSPAEANPRQFIFKHSWPKDFHVSPFNSRKGCYTLTTTDPLSSPSSPRITITLCSSKVYPKLVASLTPTSAAIDPATLTPSQKLRFLLSWWWVGFLTYPRILYQAAQLYFRRRLGVWYRPEPLPGTISRRATATEHRLEAIFQRFLQHLVERVESPLVVRYIPAGLNSTAKVVMRSPAAAKLDTGAETLEIRVLTPVFYANYASAPDSYWSFATAHNTARTAVISRPNLLASLFPKAQPEPPPHIPKVEDPCFTLIYCLRYCLRRQPPPTRRTIPKDAAPKDRNKLVAAVRTGKLILKLSCLDGYVMVHESGRAGREYRGAVLKLVVAERFAFGMVAVVEGLHLLARVGDMWVLAEGLGWVVSRWVS